MNVEIVSLILLNIIWMRYENEIDGACVAVACRWKEEADRELYFQNNLDYTFEFKQ